MDAYIQSSSTGATAAASYQTIDALASLLVLLITHQPDAPVEEPNTGRKSLLSQVLSLISLTLIHSHEQNKTGFNSKPFFRLLSSILYGFDTKKEEIEPIASYLLISLRYTFYFDFIFHFHSFFRKAIYSTCSVLHISLDLLLLGYNSFHIVTLCPNFY